MVVTIFCALKFSIYPNFSQIYINLIGITDIVSLSRWHSVHKCLIVRNNESSPWVNTNREQLFCQPVEDACWVFAGMARFSLGPLNTDPQGALITGALYGVYQGLGSYFLVALIEWGKIKCSMEYVVCVFMRVLQYINHNLVLRKPADLVPCPALFWRCKMAMVLSFQTLLMGLVWYC